MQNKDEIELLKKKVKELELQLKESKKIEGELKRKEKALKYFIEYTTNVFYSHTANHEITYFSPQVFDVLGYKPEEAMVRWTELASDHPMNEIGYARTVAAINTGKVQEPYELELVHKNGKKVYVEVFETPVIENGKTIAIVGSLTDITDQKLSEKELKESEEQFRLLFEKSYDPILIIDGYRAIDCNEATIKLLGYSSKKEFLNQTPTKLSPEYKNNEATFYENAKQLVDIAYKKGYHRFNRVRLGKKGNKIYLDITLTKIPYKGKNMLFAVWRDITQQKKYEESIIESERRYSSLFEQAADGILVGIKNGKIVEANNSFCKLSGYSKEEILGKNISFLFKKEELQNKPLRYDLVKQGDTVVREREIIKKDGSLLYIETNTKMLDDGRMLAQFRDISRRKEAEMQLVKSTELLQRAEKIAGLGNYFYDMKNDIWESSEVLNEIYGIDENYEKNLKSFLEIVHPEYREEMRKYLKINIGKNKEPLNKQYKIKRISDGQERWVYAIGDLEYDSEKNPIKTFGTIQDITDRKLAETVLKQSEEKYRSIFNSSPVGIFHYDTNGIITDCNQIFVNIIGSTKEILVGLNMIKDLRNKEMKKAIKDSLKSGESRFENWYYSVTADKKTYVRVLFKGIKDNKGQIISGTGLVEDITERKEAEILLKNSEEKLKNIYQSSSDIIVIISKEGKVLEVNKSIERELLYKNSDIIGKNVEKFIERESREDLKQRMKTILNGGRVPMREIKMLAGSGKVLPYEVHSKLINYEGSKAILSVLRNISERKEFEKKVFEVMIEAEEKERKRLASDIHDEVGPLLSSLKMYSDMLGTVKDEKREGYLKAKIQELAKETITNVREVSNALSPNLLMQYGLIPAVNSFINNQKDLIKIKLKTNLDDQRFSIKIETVYYRIIKELVNNTLKHAKADKISINIELHDQILKLIYKDNGVGLKTDIINKRNIKGTGLLNIENRIRAINGTYLIENNKTKGFKLELKSLII